MFSIHFFSANLLGNKHKLRGRIDKAKKHYECAYQESSSLLLHYRMHSNKSIIPNSQESKDANFDIILKVEELRFVNNNYNKKIPLFH